MERCDTRRCRLPYLSLEPNPAGRRLSLNCAHSVSVLSSASSRLCSHRFFVTILTWPTWLSHLIYFLPNACQIGTFSLLILFYAKLVHRHRWRFLRLRFLSFCILSNTAMVLLTLTFSILMDRVSEAEAEDPQSQDAINVGDFVNQMYYVVSEAAANRQQRAAVTGGAQAHCSIVCICLCRCALCFSACWLCLLRTTFTVFARAVSTPLAPVVRRCF